MATTTTRKHLIQPTLNVKKLNVWLDYPCKPEDARNTQANIYRDVKRVQAITGQPVKATTKRVQDGLQVKFYLKEPQ